VYELIACGEKLNLDFYNCISQRYALFGGIGKYGSDCTYFTDNFCVALMYAVLASAIHKNGCVLSFDYYIEEDFNLTTNLLDIKEEKLVSAPYIKGGEIPSLELVIDNKELIKGGQVHVELKEAKIVNHDTVKDEYKDRSKSPRAIDSALKKHEEELEDSSFNIVAFDTEYYNKFIRLSAKLGFGYEELTKEAILECERKLNMSIKD
jgi:hypothetical protein